MNKVVRCISCGESSVTTSEALGLCADCIRSDFSRWTDRIDTIHRKMRLDDGLPQAVPRSEGGIKCRICGNECRLGGGETGYCGLRRVGDGGRLEFLSGSASRGAVSWYLDPLPTNCVASWVCAGGSDCGYPGHSYAKGPEYGFYNLAVFYEACSLDCIFCQNWHYRTMKHRLKSAAELAGDVTEKVSCICFFGGDPGPQVVHALAAARLARRRMTGRILRICWETNGNISDKYLGAMIAESMETGGTVKVDIKTWSNELSLALCGISNRRTYEVVRTLLDRSRLRSEPPLLVASTLLVPGYVDEKEVRSIAGFIASVNPDVPYSLLGFAPSFWMSDMPPTSLDHAERCLEAARSAGLRRVHIGNRHLLGKDYAC